MSDSDLMVSGFLFGLKLKKQGIKSEGQQDARLTTIRVVCTYIHMMHMYYFIYRYITYVLATPT